MDMVVVLRGGRGAGRVEVGPSGRGSGGESRVRGSAAAGLQLRQPRLDVRGRTRNGSVPPVVAFAVGMLDSAVVWPLSSRHSPHAGPGQPRPKRRDLPQHCRWTWRSPEKWMIAIERKRRARTGLRMFAVAAPLSTRLSSRDEGEDADVDWFFLASREGGCEESAAMLAPRPEHPCRPGKISLADDPRGAAQYLVEIGKDVVIDCSMPMDRRTSPGMTPVAAPRLAQCECVVLARSIAGLQASPILRRRPSSRRVDRFHHLDPTGKLESSSHSSPWSSILRPRGVLAGLGRGWMTLRSTSQRAPRNLRDGSTLSLYAHPQGQRSRCPEGGGRREQRQRRAEVAQR